MTTKITCTHMKVTYYLLLTMISSLNLPLIANTSVTHIETQQPIVCLTFDDGPREGTEELLDLFLKEDVKATFFVLGQHVATHPQVCQRMITEGHEIANHTYTHPHLPKLKSIDDIRQEIESTQAIIKNSTQVKPVIFRAPFLELNADVYTILDEHELVSIHANRYTDDWKPDITEIEVFAAATTSTKAGDIVLMHGWSPATRKAMPQIIKTLKAKGLRFVTVSEMLAQQSAQK